MDATAALLSNSGSPLPPWLPDDSTSECMGCRKKFSVVNRRHHCRKCGKIYCGECTKHRLQLPIGAIVKRPNEAPPMLPVFYKIVRVCNDCFVGAGGKLPVAHPQPTYAAPPAAAASPNEGRSAPPTQPEIPEETIEGPPPPPGAETAPLPEFPQEAPIGPNTGMFGLMKLGFSAMGTMAAHSNDPHLSQEDNAAKLAGNLKGNLGIQSYEDGLKNGIAILQQNHLPEGLCGFVIIAPPKPGTLGHAYGLRLYDFIYVTNNNTMLAVDTTMQQFASAMQMSFLSDGKFVIGVYNFATRRYRRVTLIMPPGKPNAILGVNALKLPPDPNALPAGVATPSDDLYTKGWRKQGGMYISSGSNGYPVYGPLTSENEDIWVKVFRERGGMWISSNEYHPLYNYTVLEEPLYVEVWRLDPSGMLIQTSGNKYAALPMTR